MIELVRIQHFLISLDMPFGAAVIITSAWLCAGVVRRRRGQAILDPVRTLRSAARQVQDGFNNPQAIRRGVGIQETVMLRSAFWSKTTVRSRTRFFWDI